MTPEPNQDAAPAAAEASIASAPPAEPAGAAPISQNASDESAPEPASPAQPVMAATPAPTAASAIPPVIKPEIPAIEPTAPSHTRASILAAQGRMREWVGRYGAQAAALAIALALGYGLARGMPQPASDNAYLVETTAGMRDSRQALARLGDDITAVKTALERLKQGVEKPRGDNAKLTQTVERLDANTKDAAERLTRLGDQLDKVERYQRDPARIAALTERLDRIEKQVSGLPPAAKPVALASPPPPTPAPQPAHAPVPPAPVPPKPVAVTSPDTVSQTGSVARPTKLEGWVLRDVEDGYALVQSSAGRLREVTVGQFLPGGVRVEAVERRGRAWVVVTNKGLITAN